MILVVNIHIYVSKINQSVFSHILYNIKFIYYVHIVKWQSLLIRKFNEKCKVFLNDESSSNLEFNDRFGKLIQKCPWIFELIFIQFYEAFILFSIFPDLSLNLGFDEDLFRIT